MKKLMFLISTEGKTTEQISKESWEAYQNYQRVKAEQIEINNKKKELKTTKKSSEL
ncbi:MAG: hypothetical protein WDA13_00945 [Candidatus Shapirobacteria bacterium]